MATPFNITPTAVLSGIQSGLDLLGGQSNFDVVGIYDGDSLRQLFADARPMRASVREISRVMDHPVETGAVLSDHHIIMPNEIDLVLVIQAGSYSSTYQQIKGAFINATKLSVQTKASVYQNMIIQACPHEENPDMYDVITMSMRLKEVIFVAPASIAEPDAPADYSPVDSVNSDVVPRGLQSPLLVTLPASVIGYVNAFYAWGR